MSVRGVDIKVGDKLRYLGGDPANTGELLRGRVYDVVDIDYDVIVIDTINNGSWAIMDEYKNVDCFELVELDVSKVKEGDKLRYLGGDPNDYGNLTPGEVYEVFDVEYGEDLVRIADDNSGEWAVGESAENLASFEFVEEGSPDTLDLVVKLSQEVANLKRELSDLREAMQAQAYEDELRFELMSDYDHNLDERIERILDDIVMLDERTQDVNNGGQKLLSKEVYIYDAE